MQKHSVKNIDIQSFDFSTIPQTGFIEILGKRGTGKTTWTQYILTQSEHHAKGMYIVMGGSETVKFAWSKFVHPLYIQDASIEYLEHLRDQRNKVIRKYQRKNQTCPPEEHVTLILDDIASVKKIIRSDILRYLASNSRHLNMCIYILVQYHCQVPTEIRNQFDYVFMLATSDMKSIKRIQSEFCSSIEYRVFQSVLQFSTENHGACVVNNRSLGSSVREILSYGNIDTYPVQPVSLGDSRLWSFAKEWYIDADMSVPTASEAEEWMRLTSGPTAHPNRSVSDELLLSVHASRHEYNDRHGKIVIRKV